MRIRLINRYDVAGGAEVVAMDQLRAYRALGHDAQLLAGTKLSDEPAVLGMGDAGRGDWAEALAGADIVHVHNLHGRYFDASLLPALVIASGVALTLHDQYAFTGGCVHTRGCERWSSGCGECPQVEAGAQDDSAAQWREKHAAWRRGRIHVIAPAAWIDARARRSILAGRRTSFQQIPNGIDTRIFFPVDRAAARRTIGVDTEGVLIVTSAVRLRTNPSKDWPLLVEALRRAAPTLPMKVTLLVLGDSGEDIMIGGIRIRFRDFVVDRARLAAHYAAADIYVHAARVETFSLTLLEAMACGCAAIATDVGGVREQFGSDCPVPWGVVVPRSEPAALAEAITEMTLDARRRASIGGLAMREVAQRWSLERHIAAHLSLYARIRPRRQR